MVQIKTEAGLRLHGELVKRFGAIEDSQGRKIYGHKRVADVWRAAVLADLRGGYSAPAVLPDAAAAGRVARAACLAVAAAGIIAALSIDGTIFGLLASAPAPTLIAAGLRRIG